MVAASFKDKVLIDWKMPSSLILCAILQNCLVLKMMMVIYLSKCNTDVLFEHSFFRFRLSALSNSGILMKELHIENRRNILPLQYSIC